MTGLRDRVEQRALSAYTTLTMAPMPTRAELRQWPMSVTGIVDVAPHVRRITFSASEFRTYESNGPDEYFGLLIPRSGQLVMPDPDEPNPRRAVHAMPADHRPELRWYSLRRVSRDTGEAEVDIVLHGDAGPGSAWATNTRIGDQLGFRQGTALYAPPAVGHELLVADETGAPALAAVLEADPGRNRTVLVEVPDRHHLTPMPAGVDVHVIERADRAPGVAALEVLRSMNLLPLGYAWVCGEHNLATGVRRHLVGERGINRRRVTFSSFWKVGEART